MVVHLGLFGHLTPVIQYCQDTSDFTLENMTPSAERILELSESLFHAVIH